MNNYKITVGIDMRTFSYSNSVSRGIGHYTINHLEKIIKKSNDWKFIFYKEDYSEDNFFNKFKIYKNVELKKFVDFNEGEIDLFHIPDPMNTSYGFDSPLRMIQNVPTTVLFHDLIPLYFYYHNWAMPTKQLYDLRLEQLEKSNCKILTNSNYTKLDLINNTSIDEKRVSNVWAGINDADVTKVITEKMEQEIIDKFKLNTPYFLYVGALDNHKNFDTMLKAFVYFSKSYKSKLIIVGKKDANTISIESALQKQSINNIVFTDYVTREELIVLYENAFSLLFLSKYEGFGLPALEAMANGCPVICSDVTSLPEVVGDAAIKVDPNNILVITEVMKQIYQDSNLRKKLSELSLERAKLFSWEKTANETLAIWSEMLGKNFAVDKEEIYNKKEIIKYSHYYNLNNENDSKIKIVWQSPIFDTSGYADEARNIILGLDKSSVHIKAIPFEWNESKSLLPENDKNNLLRLCSNYIQNLNDKYIHVNHNFPSKFEYNNRAYLNIGRTMFETDSIPKEWVSQCNKMDEIWVPSEFNINNFIKAGIKKEKLVKVHESIDTNIFDIKVSKLGSISQIKGFKFLSVFDWTLRKGWDVLLEAFLKEFQNKKNVSLILKVWASNGKSLDDVKDEIKSFLKEKFNKDHIPTNIILFSSNLSVEDLPKLYKSVDAYVSPSRGEGWGRPMMEAMAMGLPTIATRYSGQLEFMNDENSFLIDNELVRVTDKASNETYWYKSHRWAEPSVEHLSKLMLEVYSNKSLAKKKGDIAREFILNNFSRETVARKIVSHLEERLSNNHTIDQGKKQLNVTLEGSFSTNSSLGIINSELMNRLNHPEINIRKLDLDSTSENKPDMDDIIIRHSFPPNLKAPEFGKWVAIQPWEFGSLPKKWVEIFSKEVDEMWVPTDYVKQSYIESGLPEERICVIPNGFNSNIFNETANIYNLQTQKKFKFLFVGGTIYRKGIDILLNAFTELFSNEDDVCLVIKDLGGKSFYNGQNSKDEIKKIIDTKNSPEIEYIDETLKPEELAGLYRVCDVLVHPYRGEGFGMPILEAMACGLPVIVTKGGAALDFCDENNSTLINAEKVFYKEKKVGDDETVSNPWMYEVSREDLMAKMMYALENYGQLKSKSLIALENAHIKYDWSKIVVKVEERLLAINNTQPIRFNKIEETIDFDKLLVEATNYYNDSNFKGTIEKIGSIISHIEFPKIKNSSTVKADLLNISGASYLNLGELELAHNCFEEALTLDPNSSQACFGLGEVFNNAEMYQESKTMLEWAIANDEQNQNAKIRLIEVNRKLNLPEDHNSLVEENKMVNE